ADRYHGDRQLEKPLAAVQMGLIYVNPEGPNGNPDPLAAARDIRETFGRMAMNDEETVALIAGGHTFGKAHGAHKPEECMGADPAGSATEQQGIGWVNKCGTGKGVDTITSGLEGAWSVNPIAWTSQYFDNLYAFDWVQTRSPAGAIQWIPSDKNAANLVPDAHDKTKRHAPIMFTTDLSMKMDPGYRKVSERFHKDPDAFADAFARAWFKLTHRDMGPRTRYLGAEAPKVDLIWQDPVPAVTHKLVDANDVASLKSQVLASGLTGPELIRTAWAAAASYRDTDMRGGTNGGRVRLAPQKDWAVNNPAEITKVVAKLEAVQASFNRTQKGGKQISLADLIVLGGNAAIEQAAASAGHSITVPFTPGRGDATQAQTDVNSFVQLEPTADGFRNYYSPASEMAPVDMLIDRASLLSLTVPEMTVLVGGMRALNANTGGAKHGVFTATPGQLNNAFFVNLLDMNNKWSKSQSDAGLYEGRDMKTGALKWTATPVDLVFGSNSELRAVAEVYAASDGEQKFAQDFVAAWTKVMNLGLN
ncbi:MAG: catalase-peroxidase, partial [Blastomonas sp.]|nr:catalase-peroxidase [Blastomonas sp.]